MVKDAPAAAAWRDFEHKRAEFVKEQIEPTLSFVRSIDARVVGMIEQIAIALIHWPMGKVLVEHGIDQPARRAHDGHRAVAERDELRQAARLIPAGHDDHVGAGVNEMGQFLVIADFQMAIGVVV